MYYVIASILLECKDACMDNHQIPWYLVLYSGLATAMTVTCMARTEGIIYNTVHVYIYGPSVYQVMMALNPRFENHQKNHINKYKKQF